MSITFTDQLDKPSEITTIPNQLLRPVFGALYGFDVPVSGGGGTPAFTNQYSVSFDGTDDYMSIGTVSELNGSISAVTLSAWFNFSGTYHTDKNLVLSGGSSGSDRFYFQQLSATQLRYGSSSGFVNFTIPTVSASTWYHMAIVHNGTSASAYFNGSPSSSNPQTVTAPTANYGTAFKVGAYYTGSAVFGGLLDEVSVFDSALSASNITSIYNSGVPNDISSLSPVGWWRMGDNDGGTGTTITNQGSASSIDGTLTNGPTFSTSVPEYVFSQYSVSLDGSDDYINVPHAASLNLNSGMTLSAWVYWNSLTGYPMIFNKRTLSQHTYQLYQNGNKLRFNNGSVVTSNTTLSTGAWFHCAVTCTSGGTVIFYLNGSADGGGNAAGSISTNTNPLEIGGMSWAANRTNGFIDEASVFNSVLSASDITEIYNSGVPADISSLNPVGWWRMGDNDSGTGTTVTDQGSGGNDGTLTNGPTFSTTVPS